MGREVRMQISLKRALIVGGVAAVVLTGGYVLWGRADSMPQAIAAHAPHTPHTQGRTDVAPVPSKQSRAAARTGPQPPNPQVFRRVGPKAYEIAGNRERRPPGDALEYMRVMKRRSDAGDADASYLMELTVRECRNLIKHDPVASFDFLRNAGMTPDPASLVNDERRLGECASLVAAPAFYHGAWLARAASQGSIEAKLLYAADPETVIGPPSEWLANPESLVRWRESAMRHLHDAAATGSLDAVSHLSSAYDKGRITAYDGVNAYAYALAAAKANPAHMPARSLQELQAKLSPAQREAARERATQVYADCCIADQ